MKLLLPALPLSLAAGLATGFLPQDAPQVEVVHLSGPVWMLTGQGGNLAFSAGEDGILLVDSQFAPMAGPIRAALAEHAPGRPVRFLLDTHWHGDHTGGNAALGAGVTILAHDNVRRRLTGALETPGREAPPLPREGLPVLTYGDRVSLHLNGEEVQVLHLPRGHTDGDSIVLFPASKVVHMGDLLFADRFPFVDLDSGGDVLGLLHAVEEVLHALPDGVRVIPGHGPLTDLEGLRRYQRMLQESVQRVREALAAGQTPEEIVAAGMGPEWKDWSWQFVDEERWLRTVVRSLERNPGRSGG